MHIDIRPETEGDEGAIEALIMAAFAHAPHTAHTEQFIVKALRRANALTVSLVATAADRIVAHIAISPVRISDGAAGWYGLGPLAVQPADQQQGIGSRLMRAALHQLHELEAAGCVVLGDPQYYGRFAFRPEQALVLPGVSAAYFQALSFGSALPHGMVAYHAAFSATGEPIAESAF